MYWGSKKMKELKNFIIYFVFVCINCNAVAQTDKGIEYYSKKDFTNAIACFLQAAEQGDSAAQVRLANCYYNGEGVNKNYPEAVKWYKKAAEQGDVYAQYKFGRCYDFGEGVIKDQTEAVNWYKKAAEQGLADAQYNLA